MTQDLVLLAYSPLTGYGLFKDECNKTKFIEYPYAKPQQIDLNKLSSQFWMETVSIEERFLSLEALISFLKDEYLRANTSHTEINEETAQQEVLDFENKLIKLAIQKSLKAAALQNFEEAFNAATTLQNRFGENKKIQDLTEALYKFRDYQEYATGNIDYEGITAKISEPATKNIQILSRPVATNRNLLDKEQKQLLDTYFEKLNGLHTQSIAYKRVINIEAGKVIQINIQ